MRSTRTEAIVEVRPVAAESPASGTVAGPTDRPQATLPAVGDEDKQLVAEHELHDYPDPIDHGFGIQGVLSDLDEGPHAESYYTRLWSGWREHVGDRDAEPYVLAEDVHQHFPWLHDDYPAHLVLQSKGWKVGTGSEDGSLTSQYYEYSLQVMRYDPVSGDLDAKTEKNLRAPTSFQCWIQPQDESLVYPSGDPMICQHGEGSRFKTQTTYADPQQAWRRTVDALNLAAAALGIDRPAWETFNRESWKVWKGEVHHRFKKQKMESVVHRLAETKTLLQYGGGSVSTKGEMRNGRHVEEMVVSDRWDKLGIAKPPVLEDSRIGAKVYRIRGSPRDERLKHPKIETYLAGTDGELPHADDWSTVRRVLRQLVSSICVRASVNLGDLVADDYYDGYDQPMRDFYMPMGWRQAVREANDARLAKMASVVHSAQTPSKLDVVYTIADREGADYDQLAEATGLSKSRVQEIVAEFVNRDVLARTNMPRLIVFDNEDLRLSVLDELHGWYPDDADPRAIADRAERRRERRQQRREERASDEPDESADGDSDRPGADEGDESDPEWLRVDELDYSREDVARYLERGDIPARDAKIRVSSHRWLAPRG